jgi:hypothetical protein
MTAVMRRVVMTMRVMHQVMVPRMRMVVCTMVMRGRGSG